MQNAMLTLIMAGPNRALFVRVRGNSAALEDDGRGGITLANRRLRFANVGRETATGEAAFPALFSQPLLGGLAQLDNMVVFAAGAAASGKTTTVINLMESFYDWIADEVPRRGGRANWSVDLHAFELLREEGFDLLGENRDALRLNEQAEQGWVYFDRARPVSIHDAMDLERALATTQERRRDARGGHVVYEFIITCEVEDEWRRSVIFVDLAASNRGGDAKAMRSLLVLQDTLLGLEDETAARTRSFTMRNSKLTRYLRPFLDGDVAMVACVSADEADKEESLRTLLYARRLQPFFGESESEITRIGSSTTPRGGARTPRDKDEWAPPTQNNSRNEWTPRKDAPRPLGPSRSATFRRTKSATGLAGSPSRPGITPMPVPRLRLDEAAGSSSGGSSGSGVAVPAAEFREFAHNTTELLQAQALAITSLQQTVVDLVKRLAVAEAQPAPAPVAQPQPTAAPVAAPLPPQQQQQQQQQTTTTTSAPQQQAKVVLPQQAGHAGRPMYMQGLNRQFRPF